MYQQPQENGIADVLKKIEGFFDPNSWECPYCSTDNPEYSTSCVGCGKHK